MHLQEMKIETIVNYKNHHLFSQEDNEIWVRDKGLHRV